MLDLQPEDKNIVLEILTRHLPIDAKVWVFGSRVRGNAKPYSDLDLAIDLNGQRLSSQLLADLAYDFEESDLPYKVDIVDWNNISTAFQAHIQPDFMLLKLSL